MSFQCPCPYELNSWKQIYQEIKGQVKDAVIALVSLCISMLIHLELFFSIIYYIHSFLPDEGHDKVTINCSKQYSLGTKKNAILVLS